MQLKKLFNRKKNHRREPRANAFVLESLEPRLLLSATPMTAAVVTTDHLDYAPGETAVITTANTHGDGLQFGAGEFVRFQVTRTDGMTDAAGTTADVGPTGNEAWYVADGVGGFRTHLGADVSGDGVADWIAPDNDLTVNSSISTTWFVEEQYRNSSLLVTAAGQESGAVASQAFTDAAENTTTTVTSSAGTSTYGDEVTFTATVTAAVGANGRPTGTVEFYDGVTLIGTTTTDSFVSATQSSFSITISTLTAGSHASISAQYHSNNTGDTGWNDSTSGTIAQTVSQKTITGFITVADKVYDGTTAATELSRGLVGVLAGDEGNVILSNGPNGPFPLGGPAEFQSAKVDFNASVFLMHAALTGSAASNYRLNDYNIGTLADITPKGITASSFTADSKVYDGTTAATVQGGTLDGVVAGDDVNLGGTATFDTANAGLGKTVTLTGATLTGTAAGNYTLASPGPMTTTADITVLGITGFITVADKVYDGTTAATELSRGLNGVLAGDIGNVILSNGPNGPFPLGGPAEFQSAKVDLNASVFLMHAVLTGTAASNYRLTDANIGTTADITYLDITGSFAAVNKVYDGTTAATVQSGTLTGVIAGDDVNLGGTATFDTADAGVGKTVTLTGATLVGTAAGNYRLASLANTTTTADITKADATVSVNGYTGVYDAAAHGATGSATGIGGEDLSAGLNLGASFTNAPGGTANWTFSGGANYNDANGSVAIVIAKADATVNVLGYTGTYDAAAHGASGTATGVGGEDLSGGLSLGASFTNAPGGMADWTFSGGTNYHDANGSVAIVINKADATVNVLGYTGTYDGAAHGATGSATGIGGEDLSAGLNLGASFTNVPGGTADWTFSGGTNYHDANGSVAIVINKANAVLTLTGYYGAYDGAAHQATGTATGVLGEDLSAGLDLSVTSHTNAGVYIDTVTFTDVTGNYKDTIKNVKSTVNQANATLVLTGYYGSYDGAAHQATGTATGVLGEDLSAGLNLSGTSHTNAGVYIDTVTFTDGTGNYKDTIKNVKSTVNQANATLVLTGYYGSYDGAAHQATGTATGVLGEDLSAGLNLSGTSHTNAGVYIDTVTFTDGTGNYKDTIKNVKITINQANAVLTVTGYSVTFDGLAHTATGTATGVLGEDLSAGLDLSSTTHTNVGTYLNVVTFTDVTGNYKFTVKNVSSRIL